MVRADKAQRKSNFFLKVAQLFKEYPKVLLVNADNVGSKQMQQIRKSLQGKAVLLMGKNTMIRKAIQEPLKDNPNLEQLLPHFTGNVGIVFSKEDLTGIKELLLTNKVKAPAKPGAIATSDVLVQAHNTGLDPSKTSFFQALDIPTKISRGSIEIIKSMKLITKGDKVGMSEATLLAKLGISPFTHGLSIERAYDGGTVFDPAILDEHLLITKFKEGVNNVAAISLKIGYANLASVPHMLLNGMKNVISVGTATNATFDQAKSMDQ